MGPVPMPNKMRCFTVLRSPHIDKKSREQFELTTHRRILDIVSPSDATMDALMKLSISSGVDVEIKSKKGKSMVNGLWGKKIGMTQVFSERIKWCRLL